MNNVLAPFKSQLVNARVLNNQGLFSSDLFTGELAEESRFLYLRQDMVVTQSLNALFEMDMEGFPVASVKDMGAQVYFGKDCFNAGLLMIDLACWKKDGWLEKIREEVQKFDATDSHDEQKVLNQVFDQNWFRLSASFNFIPIHEDFIDWQPHDDDYPAVIHYLTERKPWLPYIQSTFREVWWYYHNQTWSEIQRGMKALIRQELANKLQTKFSSILWIRDYCLSGLLRLNLLKRPWILF